jgi:hypothetical protein
MQRTLYTRLFSLGLAAMVTFAVLGGIDHLAQTETSHEQMALVNSARA